jgi:transposase
MTPRRAYRTDLSDARWALVEPVLAAWRAARAEAGLGLSAPVHDLREIVNAILYVNRTGIAWEYLPHDFPPYKTVYDYYAKWEKDGTTETIHDELRRRVRRAAGRSEQPSAVIMDAPVDPDLRRRAGVLAGHRRHNHAGRAVMPGGRCGRVLPQASGAGEREMPGITTDPRPESPREAARARGAVATPVAGRGRVAGTNSACRAETSSRPPCLRRCGQ